MAQLIRARHAELGVVCEVPNTEHYLDNGWSPVSGETPLTVDSRDLFDPSAHNAADVVAYLSNVNDPAEHQRVQDAERADQARKTILDWQPVA